MFQQVLPMVKNLLVLVIMVGLLLSFDFIKENNKVLTQKNYQIVPSSFGMVYIENK